MWQMRREVCPFIFCGLLLCGRLFARRAGDCESREEEIVCRVMEQVRLPERTWGHPGGREWLSSLGCSCDLAWLRLAGLLRTLP